MSKLFYTLNKGGRLPLPSLHPLSSTKNLARLCFKDGQMFCRRNGCALLHLFVISSSLRLPAPTPPSAPCPGSRSCQAPALAKANCEARLHATRARHHPSSNQTISCCSQGQPEADPPLGGLWQAAVPLLLTYTLLLRGHPDQSSTSTGNLAPPAHKLPLNLVKAKQQASLFSSCTISPSTNYLVRVIFKFELRHGSKLSCYTPVHLAIALAFGIWVAQY